MVINEPDDIELVDNTILTGTTRWTNTSGQRACARALDRTEAPQTPRLNTNTHVIDHIHTHDTPRLDTNTHDDET